MQQGNALAEPNFLIKNMVATADLGCPVELSYLAKHLKNIEYNPYRFSAAVLRLHSPTVTILIFPTGKIVITGAKLDADARRAAKKCVLMVKMLGYRAHGQSFMLRNVVALHDVGFRVCLTSIAKTYPELCEYDPDVFPGLTYHHKGMDEEHNPTSLIYGSGKIVITGTRGEVEARQYSAASEQWLAQFRAT